MAILDVVRSGHSRRAACGLSTRVSLAIAGTDLGVSQSSGYSYAADFAAALAQACLAIFNDGGLGLGYMIYMVLT